MKPVFLNLIFVILLGFSIAAIIPNKPENVPVFLDQETSGIGEIISSDDTITNSLSFRNLTGQSDQYLLYIYVDSSNTGTIKFSLNESMDWPNDSTPPDYNWKPWGAGARLNLTVSNNRDLYYKASASGQSFTVFN